MLNPLQRHIAKMDPLASGTSIHLRLPIEGISDVETLTYFVRAGEQSGHWIIRRSPYRSFGVELTTEGEAFFSQYTPE